MPGIVISSVSEKGTCLDIAQIAIAHIALQYAQAGEQTFNVSLLDWESRAWSSSTHAEEGLEGSMAG